MTHQPEKLNLWDRLFNRYRKEVYEEGKTELYDEYDKPGIHLPAKVRHWGKVSHH